MTDSNGLIYMRARYYSSELRRFINADIIAGEISNAITLNRYAYANGNPVSNIDPFGLSAERGETTIKPAYEIPIELYQQILNSKLNSAFAPNQKGYGNIIATELSILQFYTTQKYSNNNSEKWNGWKSITYLFITLPVSEWRKSIVTTNLYNDDLANLAGFVLDVGVGFLSDKYGIQGGDSISELYKKADEWGKDNLSNVVLDEFSRYIANNISGKKSTEEVTIFMGAYKWTHKENHSTKEWNTSYIGYGYAWSNMSDIFK